jgi:ArsR family transcriptional regulator, arsenate/arsenite/antimonite-responsive transcriptional repressor
MKQERTVAALAALAQGTRLDIYRLLVQAGAAGLPAGRIGETLDLALPTLSFHLAQLRHAGLVTARRLGRSIIYAANYAEMNRLIAYLTENCCAGDAALCAPVACAPAAASQPVSEGGLSDETPARARRR